MSNMRSMCLEWRGVFDLEQREGDEGQDVAEYAMMLAAILVIVVGTIRQVGSNANTASRR
jgi:hypothetical protein